MCPLRTLASTGLPRVPPTLFQPAYTFIDGMLAPSEEPGLEVSYVDRVATAHPCAQAYLRVNRLLDGTMHDW